MGSRQRTGGPLVFYSPVGGHASLQGLGLKQTQGDAGLPGRRDRKKTTAEQSQDGLRERPCSAAGRQTALGLTADKSAADGARRHPFALDFFAKNRVAFRGPRNLPCDSTRSLWCFHIPRIWKGSINRCAKSVKRKTQNVANLLAPRLFVVVHFPANFWGIHTFCTVSPRATLTGIQPLMKRTFFFLLFSGLLASQLTCARKNCRATGRSCGHAARLRRKTAPHRNSQRRKN